MARICKLVLPISMLRRDRAHASVECAIKLKVGSRERGAACDEGGHSRDEDFPEKGMIGVNLRASAELTLWGVSRVRGGHQNRHVDHSSAYFFCNHKVSYCSSTQSPRSFHSRTYCAIEVARMS
jgi:hypothetical protein